VEWGKGLWSIERRFEDPFHIWSYSTVLGLVIWVPGRCVCSVDRLLRVVPLLAAGRSDMIWNSGAGLVAVNDGRLLGWAGRRQPEVTN